MKVKIMIDSASDFTAAQAKELGLLFMPMEVRFEGRDYLDGVDLFASEFYEKLKDCKELPQTSLINEFRWTESLQAATADGSEVVVITISSKLSGTYRAAQEAAKAFDGKVCVVDSLNAAYGEGILITYALRLRAEGKSAREIAALLDEKKKDICVYAVIDTLKYLKKGGRISAVTAVIGTTLSVKPIVGVIEGEVKMVGKAVGNKKGNAALNAIVEKLGGIDAELPWGYIWSGNDRTNIDKYIRDSAHIVPDQEKILRVLGSTIGTNIGAGAVGLAFFKNERK